MQCALLDEDRGDGAAARIFVGFEDEAACGFVGVCLEFEHFGLQLDEFEEIGDAIAAFGRYFFEDGRTAPFFGDEFVFSQGLTDAFGVCAGLVDLIDGDDDGDAGCFGVVDGFDGLRHDAVVGGDDEND